MSRRYGNCQQYMFECPNRNQAEHCGTLAGLMAGVGIALPLCVYGHSSLGIPKCIGLTILILVVVTLYTRRNYGEKWETTQRVKTVYAEQYPRKTCEKLLILREGGYVAKP